jgi:hypothetical protein
MDLVVTPAGTLRAIYSEAIDLTVFGAVAIRRASQVEPEAQGRWWADLRPVAGPVLGPFDVRSLALDTELAWLEANWLSGADLVNWPVSDDSHQPVRPVHRGGREVISGESARRITVTDRVSFTPGLATGRAQAASLRPMQVPRPRSRDESDHDASTRLPERRQRLVEPGREEPPSDRPGRAGSRHLPARCRPRMHRVHPELPVRGAGDRRDGGRFRV